MVDKDMTQMMDYVIRKDTNVKERCQRHSTQKPSIHICQRIGFSKTEVRRIISKSKRCQLHQSKAKASMEPSTSLTLIPSDK